MRVYNTQTGEFYEVDDYKAMMLGLPEGCVRFDEWPALKKAIWQAVTEARINDGYVNAWELTETIYQRCVGAVE